MSIATLDPVEAIQAYLVEDAILGKEQDLIDAGLPRLKDLIGVGVNSARCWSPIAGMYDHPSEGLIDWANQAPAIVFETANEEPQADNADIKVVASFKCYGGPDDQADGAVTYRMARKVSRALRARLHAVSGKNAGGRWLTRSDQTIGTQAPVDEDGFPFFLAGYALTLH